MDTQPQTPSSRPSETPAAEPRPSFDTLDQLLAYYRLPFTLRPDQVKVVEDTYCFDRVGLFAEVGTGKTAMATVLALCWDRDVNIVLMPPILLRQWAKWLRSVDYAGDVLIYRGSVKVREDLRQGLLSHRWVLMSIGIFKNDYRALTELLMSKTVTTIVDEAHSIKNVGSQNYKKVRDFVIGGGLQLLTGTPLSNPGDGYAYVKLKTPMVYKSQKQFEDIHVEERDYFGNIQKWRNLQLLKDNLMLQSVRLLTADVLKHLHKPNYIPLPYDLDPEHRRLYDQLMNEQLLLLPDGGQIDATSAGRLYNMAQQIVLNAAHFMGVEYRSAGYDLIDHVCDEIDVDNQGVNEDGTPAASKLIIFTYYRMTSAAVVEYLRARGAVACYSDISSKQQETNIDRFMNDPACRILVAQPTSAGFGLNPQHVCSEVLFLEEPVVPKDFHQGVGRVYRDGQTKVPNIRIAIAEGTIQNRLHERLLMKDELVNRVQTGYQDLRDAIGGR